MRVMITAGGSGIGLAIARAFLSAGAKVHVCDVDEAALSDLRTSTPEIAASRADVADEDSVAAWFDRATYELGGLDVLVNNAGVKGPTGNVEDLGFEDWRQCLAICLDAQFLGVRKAAPILKSQGSGSIINLSSNAGLFGYGLRSPYAAAKWAVIGFTKSIAIELGPYNVRANAICPGAVQGPRMQRVIDAEAANRGIPSETVYRELVASQSIKRFVTADEVAAMCLYLTSPAAEMITGQAISIDGHSETFHIGS